ncbi:cuticle protein 7-like [Neocloeon triangulifer]|uniref:cuticle protein 7-like n=1 Tax=Neocloeon triangulifer TaxID=2078957 RepID=UPI00286F7A9F|nr:cuticle protein 7-like [Neocloeon triangulifer]
MLLEIFTFRSTFPGPIYIRPTIFKTYKRVLRRRADIKLTQTNQASTTNMAFKLITSLLLVAAPLSLAQYGGYHAAAPALAAYDDHHGPAEYAFEYAVHDDHTKDIHSHKESRKGDRTEGEYSLVEPDGTIRTVKYHVDGKSGFIAEVIRSGHAIHAAPVVAKPVYVAKPIVAAYKPIVAAYKPVVAAPVYAASPATSYVQSHATGYSNQYNSRHY